MKTTCSNKTDFREKLMDAWDWVNREFPFEGYIPSARRVSYFAMPKTVLRWLGQSARILDYGAGPCDKTAMLSQVGYNVTAFDDLGDNWYNFEGNRENILGYAAKAGIEYLLPDKNGNFEFRDDYYDAIILNNVIEHFHDSPRKLLNKVLGGLKTGGFIFIDVPNAANLRKRIDLARGRTNYPSFDSFYWSSYPWRGHVREFVKDDLIKLGQFLGLETVEISSHHYHLDAVSPLLRKIVVLICKILPSLRESWLFVGKKPVGWKPHNVPTEAEATAAFSKKYFKYDKDMIDWEEL
jgi:SAM-dependent methyltransferase